MKVRFLKYHFRCFGLRAAKAINSFLFGSKFHSASATGKTKKDAKQEAAKALLVKMDNDVEQYLIPTATKEEFVSPIVEVDPEVPGNPVGDLNDLCTKLKRLPPEYEVNILFLKCELVKRHVFKK